VPLNLPNALTLSRIAFVPLMLVLLLEEETGPLPADGHLARSRGLVTTFGRIADPLADKLLVGTALITLVAIDRLALWIALVIGVREAGVALLRWHAGRQGIVLHVSQLGKVKTCFQMTAIATLMLVPDPDATWVWALLMAVVWLTVLSGAQYVVEYARQTGSNSRGSSRRVSSMYSRM
jgi:CDP-diacylglycerol--glycerol-3-phosphate 3-phosphatidyltransferase